MRELDALGRKHQRVGRSIEAVGDSIAGAGKSMTAAVTMPILGAATAAVKTAADFEAGMSKVKAISGASADDMVKLTQKAKEMGATTKFTATESADAFSYMAMAGWKTEQMLGGIAGIENLAAASGEELGRTSDIVTDAMTAFGLAADGATEIVKNGITKTVSNVDHFADVLAAAMANSNTNVDMLGESFKYVAPVAGTMGYKIEDTALALGLMANNGIKASSAGTALRSLLTNLADPKSDRLAAAMERTGISLQDSKGKMKGLKQLMDDMRKGMPKIKITQDEYNSSLEKLQSSLDSGEMSEKKFEKACKELATRAYGAEGALMAQNASILAGKTGMAGMLSIIGASNKDYKDLTESIYGCDGAAKEMADEMMNNLEGQLTLLQSAVDAISQSFGERLMPHIKNGVSWMQKLADKLVTLSPQMQDQVIKWGMIAAAIGPAALVFGKLVSGVGAGIRIFGTMQRSVAKAGGVMNLLLSPGGKVVLLMAALVAAGILVYKNWDKIKDTGVKTWNMIKKVLEDVGLPIEAVRKKFGGVGQQVIALGNTVKDAWAAMKPQVMQVGIWFENIFIGVIGGAIGAAVGYFAFLVSTVTEVVSGILKIFNGLIGFVVGTFTGDWRRAWQGVVNIFGGIFQGLAALIKAPINGVISIINGAISGINRIGENIPDWIPGAGNIHLPTIPLLYKGTPDWIGGPAMVHDRGAEIIDLPRGSRVYPHDQSLEMARAEGRRESGGRSVVLNIPKLADKIVVREDADIERIMDEFSRWLEKVEPDFVGA